MSDPAPAPSPRGQQFGRYLIQRELGRGGMGIVYKALDPQLNRAVALKVLIGEDAITDSDRVKRFMREAQSIARLRHTNVVHIHDMGQIGNKHFFTMDYIEGGSLEGKMQDALAGKKEPARLASTSSTTRTAKQPAMNITSKTWIPGKPPTTATLAVRPLELSRMETAGPYNLYDTLTLIRDMARALGEAHTLGIIHRDIKPANILLDQGGTPFLTDFGLAKEVGELAKSVLTITGTVIGTPKYMSPEQAAGRVNDMVPASDVWSLGVVLYEMLTAKTPFEAQTLGDLFHDIAKKNPPAPSVALRGGKRASSGAMRSMTSDVAQGVLSKSQAGGPRVPQQVDEMVMKCLEKDPSCRYLDGNAMADDIDRYLAGKPIEANATVALQQSRITAQRKMKSAAERERGQRQALLLGAIGVPMALIALWIVISANRKSAAESAHNAAIREVKNLIEAKEWKEAQERVQAKLKEYPDDPELTARFSQVQDHLAKVRDALWKADQGFERKDFVAAKASYEDALALDPSDERARSRLADVGRLLYKIEDSIGKADELLKDGKAEEALTCYDDALAICDHDPRAVTGAERAKNAIAMAKRPPDQAVAPARGPRDPKAEEYYRKAQIRPAETEEVWKECLSNIDRALAIDPAYGDAWYERGVLHHKLGDIGGAMDDFAKAIQFGSFVVYSHYFRGRILYDEVGDLAAARLEFQAAINADPTHEYVLAAKARIAATDGNLGLALDLANQALARTKTLDDVYFVMGFVYGSDEYLDLDKALACYNKALELNPTIAASWGNRSVIHYMRKEYEPGLRDAEKAIELSHGFAVMLEKKALNMKGLGRFDESVKAYDEMEKQVGDKMISIFINRGDCQRTWAETLDKQGKAAEGKQHLERCIADWEHFLKLQVPAPYRGAVEKGLRDVRQELAAWR